MHKKICDGEKIKPDEQKERLGKGCIGLLRICALLDLFLHEFYKVKQGVFYLMLNACLLSLEV